MRRSWLGALAALLLFAGPALARDWKLGFIGDSITVLTADQVCTVFIARGDTATCNNQGHSGYQSGGFVSGSAALIDAKTAFAAAGVTIVHVMLGTNDTASDMSVPEHLANMTSLINDLVASGYKVVVSKIPWADPAFGWVNVQTLAQPYRDADLTLVNGTTVAKGDDLAYDQFFADHTLLGDGVHPSSAGQTVLSTDWANAIAAAFGPTAGGLRLR